MRNLLIFILALAGAGIFFHDKQQAADLAAAEDQITQLTQQLTDKEAALNALRAKMQQAGPPISQAGGGNMGSQPSQPAVVPSTGTSRLHESGSLDRPAYGSDSGSKGH